MFDEGQPTVRNEPNIGRIVQQLISFVGIFYLLWLSFMRPISSLQPLPTLAARCHQIRVPLLAFLGAILCVIWWTGLLALGKRKMMLNEIRAGIPQRPGRGLPPWVRLILAYLLFLGLVIWMGQDFERFLWPHHANLLVSVTNVLVLLGFIFGPFLREPRNVTQVPVLFGKRKHGTGKVAVNSLVLFAVVLVVSVAVIVGIDLAAKMFQPAYGTAVTMICGIPVLLTCAVTWALLVPWDTIIGHFGLPDEARK